jgi:hypothetical protein
VSLQVLLFNITQIISVAHSVTVSQIITISQIVTVTQTAAVAQIITVSHTTITYNNCSKSSVRVWG